MAMVKKVFILGAGASRELEFDSSTLDIYSEQKSQHSIKGPLSKGFFILCVSVWSKFVN